CKAIRIELVGNARDLECVEVPVRQGGRQRPVRPVQAVAVPGDGDASVSGMLVSSGIVGEVVARRRIASRGGLSRLFVDLLLRQGLATEVAKAVKPGHGLLAADAVQDVVDQDARDRSAPAIAEHRYAEVP